ncbi:outer membrane protein assembly factor BamD [Aliifodinibius sp. S!AR15-10]|uniref:outer membrane protein assembly factor BamD n=1 Tax=Aliifodinibius sp. S!AR15-10 TaxID=2950437 RepID=UPI00285EB25A|nr:outer membrane protein assembly factor BamD [Aliifodinibius sp. S!AR15-10]MDR8391573.1 outer membrane protein assembly factor BamD [Aliifodinibius sp. S!AR15-10]
MDLSSTRLFTVIILIAAFVFTSCSKDNYIQRGDSLPEAYRKSMRLFQEGDYSEAVKAFETVFSLGRGTEYARNAQYFLAESHFNNKNYLMAASEYERYSSLYPRSDKSEEVEFKEAYCYYKLSPRYRLDQKYTRRALEKFNLFVSNHPNSERLQEIAKYEDELREKLARKIYNAADLYMRIDEYEAAAIYYGLTIDQYPETQWAERALVDQINAYNVYAENSVSNKQEERYQKAVASYEKYLQLFPNGEHRSQAEEYVDEARVALAQFRDTSSPDSSSTSTTTASNTPRNER